MLVLLRYLLAPILLAQAARVRRTAPRLPEAAGQRFGLVPGRAPGPPIRLLFVGDSSAAGVGVARQEQAMPYQCAVSLQQCTGRSVQWQLLAKSGINTAEAIALLERHRLGPADVIVTVLGVNDVTSQRTPSQFLSDYRRLIAKLRMRTGASLAVINGLPPMNLFTALPNPLRWYLGRYARHLDAHLRVWTATQPQLRHLPLASVSQASALATDGYHPSPEQYCHWAERMAQDLAELLQSSTA